MLDYLPLAILGRCAPTQSLFYPPNILLVAPVGSYLIPIVSVAGSTWALPIRSATISHCRHCRQTETDRRLTHVCHDPLQAYTSILHQLVSSAPTSSSAPSAPSNHTVIRLLISHNLMGTIIGRNGLKIKNIQDVSGARMVAQKDMLPQSTERIVEVQGSPDAIGKAIEEIGKCLLEDWERGLGTVLYHPGAAGNDTITTISGLNGRRASTATAYNNPASLSAIMDVPRRVSLADFSSVHSRSTNASTALSSAAPSSLPSIASNVPLVSVVTPPTVTVAPPPAGSPGPATNGAAAANGAQIRTQSISIPSDMVGCIIGRAGTKITEIRRLSGSKISIAKGPHDDTGERMFTIQGTPEANEKALYLLYNQLESEKERRVSREVAQQQSAEGAAAPA